MLFESNLNAVIISDSNFFPGQKHAPRNFSASLPWPLDKPEALGYTLVSLTLWRFTMGAAAQKVVSIKAETVSDATVNSHPEWKHELWKISDITKKVTDKVLEINPADNRASTVASDGNSKNTGIILSIINKLGISALTLRDITDSARHNKLYGKSYKYLVMDAGHRCRAILWFIDGKFFVKIGNKKYDWNNLDESVRQDFLNFEVSVDIVKCTEEQSSQIFENLNKTTKVDSYALIMKNDESTVVEFIRKLTRDWAIYKSDAHPLFAVSDRKQKPLYMTGNAPNLENLWDKYGLVVTQKVIAKNNTVCSEEDAKKLIKQYGSTRELPKVVRDNVEDFLSLVKNVAIETNHKFSLSSFGAFQAVYFRMWENERMAGGDKPKVNPVVFGQKFILAYTALTHKTNEDTMDIYGNGEQLHIRKIVKNDSYAFTKPDLQNLVADLILDHMSNQD
jgi:hypothetical protein